MCVLARAIHPNHLQNISGLQSMCEQDRTDCDRILLLPSDDHWLVHKFLKRKYICKYERSHAVVKLKFTCTSLTDLPRPSELLTSTWMSREVDCEVPCWRVMSITSVMGPPSSEVRGNTIGMEKDRGRDTSADGLGWRTSWIRLSFLLFLTCLTDTDTKTHADHLFALWDCLLDCKHNNNK